MLIGVGLAVSFDVDGTNLGVAGSGGGVPDLVAVRVTLTPAGETSGHPGDVLDFIARAYNAAGDSIPGRTFTAELSDSSIASVSIAGSVVSVTLTDEGTASVTAEVGAVHSDSIEFTSTADVPDFAGAVLRLIGGHWFVDTDEGAVADGYYSIDGDGVLSIDPDASSGETITVVDDSIYVGS